MISHKTTGWWHLKYFYVHPELWGRWNPCLTIIFFKGVGESTTKQLKDSLIYLEKKGSLNSRPKLALVCYEQVSQQLSQALPVETK